MYDGCADPVFVGELARAILTGGTGVDHEYDLGHGPESRPTSAQVRGTGSADDDRRSTPSGATTRGR